VTTPGTSRATHVEAKIMPTSFLRFAETLNVTKAIFVHIANSGDNVPHDSDGAETASTSHDFLRSGSGRHPLLHPVTTRLLAYRLGDAVNAADTSHQYKWRPQGDSGADAADSHKDGGSRDIFDEYRITLI
jgi:hypothetical protein